MYLGKAKNDERLIDCAKEPIETSLQELTIDNLIAGMIEGGFSSAPVKLVREIINMEKASKDCV